MGVKCRLKALLAEKNLTARELSRRAKVSETTISSISAGRVWVTKNNLNKIIEALDIKDISKIFEIV